MQLATGYTEQSLESRISRQLRDPFKWNQDFVKGPPVVRGKITVIYY